MHAYITRTFFISMRLHLFVKNGKVFYLNKIWDLYFLMETWYHMISGTLPLQMFGKNCFKNVGTYMQSSVEWCMTGVEKASRIWSGDNILRLKCSIFSNLLWLIIYGCRPVSQVPKYVWMQFGTVSHQSIHIPCNSLRRQATFVC